MVTVSTLKEEDMDKVREIHRRFYSHLEFPDFFNGFLCSFVIQDDDEMVLAGGVRLIAESTILTNKDLPPTVRVDGLLETLKISKYVCHEASPNLKQLHAFIDDKYWSNQLQRHGFRKMVSEALVLDI